MLSSSQLARPTLLLLPTELERTAWLQTSPTVPESVQVEVCGFGPVAAAARTAALLAQHRPAQVVLLGIAGAYGQRRLPVGQAICFSHVVLDGIGAGAGDQLQSAVELGFPQTASADDRLALRRPPGATGDAMLLTVCAASGSPAEAAARQARFPTAVAEDMEGFAVALACAEADVPVAIVRGISNVVGDRDVAAWQFDSLDAAWQLAQSLLVASSEEPAS